MIKIDSISKNFSEKKVLNDITLEINNSKITAIVGLNGAGKSTLISLIAGYKTPSAGTIKKGTVSIMPDAESLYSDMTGEKFLQFMSGLKSPLLQNKSEYREISQLLFSNSDLKKKIKDYSFGMKKKISFIQAYIGDFDTYIFDEPTSGVDIESAKIMMDLLINLKNKGKAILFTSHNLNEIQEYCDYIYILQKGSISDEGDLNKIINKNPEMTYIIQIQNIFEKEIQEILDGIKYHINNHQIIIYNSDIVALNNLLKRIMQSGFIIEGFWNNASLKDALLK